MVLPPGYANRDDVYNIIITISAFANCLFFIEMDKRKPVLFCFVILLSVLSFCRCGPLPTNSNE